MREKAFNKAVAALLRRIGSYIYALLTRCEGDPAHCWHKLPEVRAVYSDDHLYYRYCRRWKTIHTYYECCRCHTTKEKMKTTKQ